MHYFQRCPAQQPLGRRDLLERGARPLRELRPQARGRDGSRALTGRAQPDAAGDERRPPSSPVTSAREPRSARTAASPSGRRSSARIAGRRSGCASASSAAAILPRASGSAGTAGRLPEPAPERSAGERSALVAEPRPGRQWSATPGTDRRVDDRRRDGSRPRDSLELPPERPERPAGWRGAATAGWLGAARRLRPQAGQAIHPAWTIAPQPGQRPGANGSGVPQNGHAATPESMYLPQCGHGCLNVGIRHLPAVATA